MENEITVAGVTFTAKQVQSAVVKIDGREISILKKKKKSKNKKIGFKGESL